VKHQCEAAGAELGHQKAQHIVGSTEAHAPINMIHNCSMHRVRVLEQEFVAS
jgi:hypothetical protein